MHKIIPRKVTTEAYLVYIENVLVATNTTAETL